MSKRVMLTWVSDGREIVEECSLVAEDDPVYILDANHEVLEMDKNILASLMNDGAVIFEDDDGLFCLSPEQIVKVEDVE